MGASKARKTIQVEYINQFVVGGFGGFVFWVEVSGNRGCDFDLMMVLTLSYLGGSLVGVFNGNRMDNRSFTNNSSKCVATKLSISGTLSIIIIIIRAAHKTLPY